MGNHSSKVNLGLEGIARPYRSLMVDGVMDGVADGVRDGRGGE